MDLEFSTLQLTLVCQLQSGIFAEYFPSGTLWKWVVLVKKDLGMWVSWANI